MKQKGHHGPIWKPITVKSSHRTFVPQTNPMGIVAGYGSPHEKGVDGGEKLAQQRDRNEVTNSRSESKKEQ
jgi:hypothetical protein